MMMSVQIITASVGGHPKWWFSKGIPAKNALHSGLGSIVICPDARDHDVTPTSTT